MIARLQPVDPNEPAVTNAQLAKLVDHARRRQAPDVRVTAEQLHEGWRKRHHRRIMGVTAGLMTAAAASWLITVVPQALVGDAGRDGDNLAVDQRSDNGMGGQAVTREASRARVQPVAPETETLETSEIADAAQPDEPPADESSVPAVEPERADPDSPPAKRPLGPSALARRADRYLATGDRERAIETWKALVTRYPKASTARGALLDLGRAYRASGQRAKARCAYKLFLKRWPYSQLRTEVERALDDLGDGPCRGLTPG